MTPEQIAQSFAHELIAHRDKLRGRAEDAQKTHQAFQRVSQEISEHETAHKKQVATVLGEWDSAGAKEFEKKSTRLGHDFQVTATAGTNGAKIVADMAGSISGAHTATERLATSYTNEAKGLLNTGLNLSGAGARGGILHALGQVEALGARYAKESGGHLKKVRAELVEAAKELRALEKEVKHDGVAEKPRGKKHHEPAKRRRRDHDKPRHANTNGLRNGHVPASRLSSVGDGEKMHKAAAEQFRRMDAAAKKDGITLHVNSGYRTYAEQKHLWDLYQSGQGNLAARPGTSTHGIGLSADINIPDQKTFNWLRQHADEYGFVNDVPSEKWHWTYTR
ncbi:D-alanyl-D-alanine carboxypeptidase-like protein [Herbihabitans rhizosphaerae]|uniref:D-alanyl-D-alanine carboxypeptidase-like protein n=1 Tax=Herbihabitans rhizosphaerae TaxID=1872711 RepID=A0A4V2ESV7_9PSEU|nr:D-alanyl-D-alanine carboxypeptidase family protein [Herbihabitans rhizosphaerae]RZS38913.1 D-alanyl-D-alanine carboxypeptidase-like protein [Herbihabitans rhizosphaerae]